MLGKAGGAAQHAGRHVGVTQGVDAGHLQRAEEPADEQCEKNHQMRRRRPEHAVADEKSGADQGVGDEHDVRTLWHVTVLSADGQTLLLHATGEDIKEVQAIAAIARDRDLTTQIWIRPPSGEAYSWD
jgi:hypothetical protein